MSMTMWLVGFPSLYCCFGVLNPWRAGKGNSFGVVLITSPLFVTANENVGLVTRWSKYIATTLMSLIQDVIDCDVGWSKPT